MNESSKKIPKSSQDLLGQFLSVWRNSVVAKHIIPPFLDIGCGDNRLAKRISSGIGIDVVNYGKANVIVKDFHTLPFKPDTFKSIAIVGSLNYFEDPETLITECARILEINGILIITMLDPLIGRFWHSLREPWAKYPGFKLGELLKFTETADLKISKKSKFMLGINNLYIFKKP